jgi:hypothetical protein
MILLDPLFPFDPTIDSGLGHRHLILAYSVVWAVQLGYICYLFRQWKSASRSDSGSSDHPTEKAGLPGD